MMVRMPVTDGHGREFSETWIQIKTLCSSSCHAVSFVAVIVLLLLFAECMGAILGLYCNVCAFIIVLMVGNLVGVQQLCSCAILFHSLHVPCKQANECFLLVHKVLITDARLCPLIVVGATTILEILSVVT